MGKFIIGWGRSSRYFRSKVQVTKAWPMKTLVFVARVTRPGMQQLKCTVALPHGVVDTVMIGLQGRH